MAETTVDKRALVEGERPMFQASYGKLMMWFFLVSDAFTFSALLVAYGALRVRAVSNGFAWADPEDVFTHTPVLYEVFHIEAPLVFVGLMTFILILSSVAMVLAVEAGHRKSKEEVYKWVFWTIVGGAAFLGCQAYEWYHFIAGTPDGGIMVSSQQLEALKAPGIADLSVVELTPAGDHGAHDDGHSGGHDGPIEALHLRNGETITQAAMISAILDQASHTHAGTYVLDREEAEELKIPNLEKNLSVKAYKVFSDDGSLRAIRLESGYQIEDPNKTDKLLAFATVTEGGASLRANEYGPADFAGLFFFVTGFHGTHVFSGVILLVILLINVKKGTYERRGHYEMTEKIGLYWHFVDLVWVFVFTFFYLI
jgi:cytochrome c oxidase subunit III